MEDTATLLDAFSSFHFEDGPAWAEAMTATIAASRAIADTPSFSRLRQVVSLLADSLPASHKYNQQQQYKLLQCDIIRDVFGDPFRQLPPLAPALLNHNDGLVVKLAQAAYDERILPAGTLDPVRLAVLADALEEAGAHADFVGHLRGPGPHVRGCFLIDALLGKE